MVGVSQQCDSRLMLVHAAVARALTSVQYCHIYADALFQKKTFMLMLGGSWLVLSRARP
jgi:hypothetical protein